MKVKGPKTYLTLFLLLSLLLFYSTCNILGAMNMCFSLFVYYLVVQDCVLGMTLCFDDFM